MYTYICVCVALENLSSYHFIQSVVNFFLQFSSNIFHK